MTALKVFFSRLTNVVTLSGLLLAATWACDAPNRSSEQGAGSEIEERAPVDPAPSDESTTRSDTTTSQNQNDTLQ